jgi:CHAT domain-containing protein
VVVLSACETARGRAVSGEGLLGLVRAFLCAGASRVVASLWKVDDAATGELMVRFHRRWMQGGLPASECLDHARRELVRDHPEWGHPKFWAAWVVWGLPS